ncbi:peptidoglycan-binding protein [Candidatus Parcubacteria bacterium]|nr:peptidoglycan-binding protein [Candidatus Parcubacteria bacterium]
MLEKIFDFTRTVKGKTKKYRRIFKVLDKKEKTALIVLSGCALISFVFLCFNFYTQHTENAPAFGGEYIEGIKGQPRFINPVYAVNDVDRDLLELLFSGLMKYDNQGKIVSDLVQDYKIKEDGKIYEFTLKKNIVWSDKQKFSVDDIIFTVKTIQNSDYKSPLRANWLGVETEKLSDETIRFVLKKPYIGFLERLTLKILPKHIWQDILPDNFARSPYNLQPVTCGQFKLKGFLQDKFGLIESLTIERDPNYFGKKPWLSEITFIFFENEEDIIKPAKQNKIKGFSLLSSQNYEDIVQDFSCLSFVLPRYFAVFLNINEQKILNQLEIREALNYATDKQEIIEKVLSGKGMAVNSPVLPKIYGYESPSEIYEYNLEMANKILEDAGFIKNDTGIREKIVDKDPSFQFKSRLDIGSQSKEVTELQKCLAEQAIVGSDIYPDGEASGYFGKKTRAAVIRFQEKYKQDVLDPYGLSQGTGVVGKSTRKKLNELCFPKNSEIQKLEFALITVQDPVLKQVGEILKQQWAKAGVNLSIQAYPISELQYDYIKPRNYEMLLFGEVLGIVPDPYPFWHSLQRNDPGLNLSLFANSAGDKLLEQARKELDLEARKEKYEEFQNILIKQAPCVFLYSPDYIYFMSQEIKGIEPGLIVDPSKRFAQVENWYIKTHRVWK